MMLKCSLCGDKVERQNKQPYVTCFSCKRKHSRMVSNVYNHKVLGYGKRKGHTLLPQDYPQVDK